VINRLDTLELYRYRLFTSADYLADLFYNLNTGLQHFVSHWTANRSLF